MREQSNPSFQKARDDVLRALVLQGGLEPEQVSMLKLDQVHLATNTLVVEPDEFDSPAATPIRLKLNEKMQRALIAWLVVRPDGPNDHLFPGAGTEGLEADTIRHVIEAEKPPDAPQTQDFVETTARAKVESLESTDLPSESVPPRAIGEGESLAFAPPAPSPSQPETPEAVSLDEIESLRKRLAESYDEWAPAVAPTAPESVQEQELPPFLPEEIVSPVEEPAFRIAEEPIAPQGWEEEDVGEPGEAPSRVPTTFPKEPWESLEPQVELGGAEPVTPVPGGLSDRLKGLWETSAQEVTLNLTYRTVALGGIALAVVVLCVGLVVAGTTMFGSGGLAGLLAGATPPETEAPIVPSPSPTSTLTTTPSPTVTHTAAPTETSVPTDTPTPTLEVTPTPIIVVVTATTTPEPPPTDTPEATFTPEASAPPPPQPTPTPRAAPTYKYPAPVLLTPENRSVFPGVINNYLRWEPVGPLADNEWYAVRLIFLQQGQPVYNGDRLKDTQWLVPDRFYYQADGPALEYRWYVFVEGDNPDGTATQLSPDSETFVFRWE